MKQDIEIGELIHPAMDCLGFAVSLIDTKGVLLYYNNKAEEILDRKPGYIGKDVYSYHKKVSSNEKIESMLQEFQNGRTEPFHYEARPYGKPIVVTLSPILKNGVFMGCAQFVQFKEAIASK